MVELYGESNYHFCSIHKLIHHNSKLHMKILLLHDKVTVASGRTLIGSGFNILSGQGTAEHCLNDIIYIHMYLWL